MAPVSGSLTPRPEKSFGTCSLDLPQDEQTSEGKVRRGFLDLRRLFVGQDVGIGVAVRLIASFSHHLPPIT
jgi:hypothetical protein